jgi:hypothetical protein
MRTVLPVTQEMDCDGAHDTTLTNAKVSPKDTTWIFSGY